MKAGEKSVHSLRNDSDRESIRVVTQKDSTGSEEIKNIVISPNGASKKISNIKGYYCELQWVQTTDDEENRYAVLTYNGIKSQTFVVFDTKLKEIYYKQEDGNSALSSVFDRYNGNQNDIAFNKDDLVVYTLQEKENDVLKIGFAANAKDNVVVKGSYKYDVEKKNNTTSIIRRLQQQMQAAVTTIREHQRQKARRLQQVNKMMKELKTGFSLLLKIAESLFWHM